MTADTDFFSDLEILALTLWGEARGEGTEGMEAVASVIVNRAKSGIKWWGQNVRQICLKPYQFSCWLKSDPNRQKLMGVTTQDPQYSIALGIAAMAIGGTLDDASCHADSYFDRRMSIPPKWANGLWTCTEIGHQLFYITEKPCTGLKSSTLT